MNIVEYFDPYNFEHLRAYEYLHKYGYWPKGFMDNLEVPSGWIGKIDMKIVDCWIKEKLEGR